MNCPFCEVEENLLTDTHYTMTLKEWQDTENHHKEEHHKEHRITLSF